MTIKKTIHELAKEFPEKTYRELEKYREEDRQQEAGTCIVGEMRKDRGIGHNNPPAEKEIDYHRYWKDMYEKEHKLRQEAEGELTIIKGIGNASPEMEALKKEIKNLKWIKDHDYIFLVDENKKLRKEIKELKEDNKKLARQIEDRVNRMRKSGM